VRRATETPDATGAHVIAQNQKTRETIISGRGTKRKKINRKPASENKEQTPKLRIVLGSVIEAVQGRRRKKETRGDTKKKKKNLSKK